MANKLQKLLYNLSAGSPVLIVFSIVWYFQKKTIQVPLVCGGIAVVLILLFYLFYWYGKANCARIQVRVVSIIPEDNKLLVYLSTYILPFASMAIPKYNVVLFAVIALAIIVAAEAMNDGMPHPLLYCIGYHFYSLGTENGMSYCLISRKKLRRKQDVRLVYRLFDYLLLEAGEKNV